MSAAGNPRIAWILMQLQDRLIRLLAPPLRGLALGARAGLAFLGSARLWNLLGLALLASGLLAGFQLLPLLYGRLSLAHEAGIAAQQSTRLGEATVLRNLQRAAFKAGFPEAALRPGTFSLAYIQEDGLEQCAISYDFIQVVNLYGLARLPLHIHARVVRPTADLPPPPSDPEATP